MPPARRCPRGVKHARKDKLSEGGHRWLDDEGDVAWDPAARWGLRPYAAQGHRPHQARWHEAP
eukprot:2044592-Pyramimonas_sp.AAC.1